MKSKVAIFGFALILVFGTSQLWASSASPSMSADEATKVLKEGNSRCTSGTPKHPNQDQECRIQTATKGQHPYATILSCSDSRAPVEILFDTGIGDLFVIRIAGNVADVDEVGTIEYGVDHLGTPVLVVLGHTRCGAVTAVAQGAKLHGNIPRLVDNIKPAVAKVKAKNPKLSGEALVEEAVRANVWQAVEDVLKRSQVVRARVKDGSVKILGAVYEIDSGKIDWMGAHPNQDQLIAKYGTGDGAHKKHQEHSKKKQ